MWIEPEEKKDYINSLEERMELLKRNTEVVLDNIWRIRRLIYWFNGGEAGVRSKNATIRKLDYKLLQARLTFEKAIKMIEKCDKELVPEFVKLMRMREMQKAAKKGQQK